MTTRQPRALLFDVDGTLVDSGGAGKAALAEAMRRVYGDAGDIDAFDFHGRTDPAIVRGLLRERGRTDPWIEARFPTLWREYYAALDRELAAREAKVTPLAGVAALFERLAAEEGRFLSGLVTGNMERGAWSKLRAASLDGHFGFGAFGSDSERRGDLPALALRRAGKRFGLRLRPAEAVVIGDTPEDIRCARAGGTRVLAVATGRHGPAELRAHRPDAVVEDLSDTDAVLRILSE
ncbi:MAG: HAD family hydrolase [Gemmatimonadota bacterium]|nr:HAD family hydrolase [Gemmatimonadota bacterium]